MEKTYILTKKGAQALNARGIIAAPGDPYTRNVSAGAIRGYLRIGFIAEVAPAVKPTIYSKLTDAERAVLFGAIDAYVEAEGLNTAFSARMYLSGMLQMLIASRKMTEQQAEQCLEETEEHRAEWRG